MFGDYQSPVFKLLDGVSGVANLAPGLTINSITETPMFCYYGGAANGTNWVPSVTPDGQSYGEILLLQAGTAPTYNQGSPLLGVNDDSVLFNAGGYYQAGNNTFADITTEDFVVEAIVKISSTSGDRAINKYQSNTGWLIDYAANDLRLTIGDGSTVSVASAALSVDVWYCFLVFCDRSGSAQVYINGIASGAAAVVSAIGSITVASPLRFGAGPGISAWDRNIAYLAMWKRDNWLDTHLQANIANERFLRLTGFWPTKHEGTAAPTVRTRSTTAYLDKLEGGQAQCIDDGDMEEEDTSSWTASNATLTKETGNPHGGLRVLRVTYLSQATGGAQQTVGSAGEKFRISGWARSDGVSTPRIFYYNAFWTGTISTEWQRFDVICTNYMSDILFGSQTLQSGSYVEFDDVTVEKLPKSKLYQVSPNWLRMCSRFDAAGDQIKGYLSEAQAQNRCLQSEDFATTWAKLDAGDSISTNVAESPNKTTTGDGLVADATDGDHGVSQVITITDASCTFSCFVKKGDKGWVYLEDSTVANCWAYFNIFGQQTYFGSKGAAVLDAWAEWWGDDWYRVGITFVGTVADHTFKIQTAEANNDKTFAGDGSTINTYLWGAQVEMNLLFSGSYERYMSSYIPTTTIVVTKTKDDLYYKGDDGNLGGVGSEQKGTIDFKFLVLCKNSRRRPFYMIDGTDSANRIIYEISRHSDNYLNIYNYTGGASQWAGMTTGEVVSNNKIHNAKVAWNINDTRLYLNGEFKVVDSVCDSPDDLDRIYVGTDNFSLALQGLISDIRLSKDQVPKTKYP